MILNIICANMEYHVDIKSNNLMDQQPRVAIVDYGMGNLYSVKRACEYVGISAEITSDKNTVTKADGIILPGVGAFGDAMEVLRRQDLVAPMKEHISSGKPFLGVCLGMQLLMTESEEFGVHKGLDIFEGKVVQFPHVNDKGERIKVPQVGWNTIMCPSNVWSTPLLDGVAQDSYMYFVHSFRVIPTQDDIVATTSVYEDIPYVSGIARNNVIAFQFHPEKSGAKGIQIYKNFAQMVCAH